jgi:hypothetical protein
MDAQLLIVCYNVINLYRGSSVRECDSKQKILGDRDHRQDGPCRRAPPIVDMLWNTDLIMPDQTQTPG